MKDKPTRSSRSVPPTRSVPPSNRSRSPQRGGGRVVARNPRNRQLLAVGALVLVLAVIAAVVIFIQRGQAPSNSTALVGSLPNESVGHFRGSANAPVTVTEWSDFQ